MRSVTISAASSAQYTGSTSRARGCPARSTRPRGWRRACQGNRSGATQRGGHRDDRHRCAACRRNRGASGRPCAAVGAGVTSAHDPCHWPRPPSSSPVSSKHLQPKLTPFGLTPVETRVLERLLRGMSLVAAAAALGIPETTAKTHLSRIFAKTGVSRQPELVALVHTSCRHCGASNPGGEGLRWNCATRL